MTETAFTEVERPHAVPGIRLTRRSAERAALLRTVDTGKALRIVPNGQSLAAVRQRVYRTAARAGLSAHCTVVDGAIIAWLEQKTDAPA